MPGFPFSYSLAQEKNGGSWMDFLEAMALLLLIMLPVLLFSWKRGKVEK